MTDLKIEYVPIGNIKPYENNAKTHPEEQIEQIKKSIEQLGFNDPIGIWHGEIVEGHGRYEAAKRLGLDNVPIIRLDDLTDEQRRKYALIHNKLTMNSPFDIDVLNVELAELGVEDMGVFGFEMLEPFEGLSDEMLDSLFTDAPEKAKKPKMIKCPHCGEMFEQP